MPKYEFSAKLKKGSSDKVVQDNIKELSRQGMRGEAAAAIAYRAAGRYRRR